jgi:hypothetical protein
MIGGTGRCARLAGLRWFPVRKSEDRVVRDGHSPDAGCIGSRPGTAANRCSSGRDSGITFKENDR